jgi:predicted Rossmann fold nucleotide-binding protein DprA/Smf involved in DNA uptake
VRRTIRAPGYRDHDDGDKEGRMADVLSELRSSLEKRLRELEPLISEHAQVRKALDALEGVGKRAQGTAARAVKRSPTAKAGSGAARRGRPPGTGGRAEQVLAHVHKQPGITVADLAKRMKIKPNYLYRVLPQLEKDGKLHKRDKGYHPSDR